MSSTSVKSVYLSDQLSAQFTDFNNRDRYLALDYFRGLMERMSLVFFGYAKKCENQNLFPLPKMIKMTVDDARFYFNKIKPLWIKSKEVKRETIDPKIGPFAEKMVEAFLEEGPLTERAVPARIELPHMGSQANWEKDFMNNDMYNFFLILDGARPIEKITEYSDAEKALLSPEIREMYPIHELPCGEYSILKSGETRIEKRLENLDRRTYTQVFEDWGYEKVEEDDDLQVNDLIIFKNAHVLRYCGNGKVQSKYGNDNEYVLEEDVDRVYSRWGAEITVYRKPKPADSVTEPKASDLKVDFE